MFARLIKRYWPYCQIVQNTDILCRIGIATSVKQAKLNNIGNERPLYDFKNNQPPTMIVDFNDLGAKVLSPLKWPTSSSEPIN
jgi:hypothetical protein